MPPIALIAPLEALKAGRFDAPEILRKLASSSRALAELKGMAASIPNQGILINTLGLQEAKDSSEIENIFACGTAPSVRATSCERGMGLDAIDRTEYGADSTDL